MVPAGSVTLRFIAAPTDDGYSGNVLAVASQAVVDVAVRRRRGQRSRAARPKGDLLAFAFDRSALEGVRGRIGSFPRRTMSQVLASGLKDAIQDGDMPGAQALVALQARLHDHSEHRHKFIGEGLTLMPGEEPRLMYDPWVAERICFG